MGAQANPAVPTKQDLKQSLDKLDMSKDELNKFEKAFKDPEFIKMFAEYAEEISDPKNRAETDAYLRQMETESRVEEVYGKGVLLIVPEEGFVVKTTQKGTGNKMFINICHSEKVEPCKGKRTPDPKNPAKSGMSWDIPLSLGKPKSGKDKKGKECDVIDFVVHPNTNEMAVRDARFRGMVVESAMESIEKNYNLKLDRSWTQPKMTYKGVEGAEQPHAMAVRSADSDAEVVDGKIKPKTTSGPSEVKHNVGENAKVAEDLKPSQTKAAPKSSFKFPEQKKKVQMLKPTKPGDIGYEYASGEVCPEYQVVERGSVDMAAAWGDAGRGLDTSINVPKALVIRVELPGCASAAGMELDLEKKAICLCIPGKFKLEKKLNHQVDDSKAKAKFDKNQQRLEITLPVIPPAPKAPNARAAGTEGVQLVQEVESQDEEVPEAEEPMGEEADSSDGTEGEAKPEESQPPKPQAEKSEVQRQFEEMMRRHDQVTHKEQESSAAAPPPEEDTESSDASPETEATAAVGTADEATGGSFIPAGSFSGARPGYKFQMGPEGLGYYIDAPPAGAPAAASKSRAAGALAAAGLSAPGGGAGGSGASSAKAPQQPKQQPPAPKLRPRLNNSLAEELD